MMCIKRFLKSTLLVFLFAMMGQSLIAQQTMYVSVLTTSPNYYDTCYYKRYDFINNVFICDSGAYANFQVSTGAIYKVDLTTCTYTVVMPKLQPVKNTPSPIFYDIAVCAGDPNTLYGIEGGTNKLYKVNATTGKATILNASPPAAGLNLNSLVCDGKGNLFAVDGSAMTFGNLYRYDIGLNTWSLVGATGYSSGGDLTYYGGNLYLTTSSGQLVSITMSPLSATPVANLNAMNMYGAVSVSNGPCANSVSLIGSADRSLYNIDPLTGNCTLKCANIVPFGDVLGGAATITESSAGPPAVLASTPTSAVCPGFGTTLNAGGASTYVWTPGGMTGTSINVTPGASTIYTVTGTDGNGCSNTATVAVTVKTPPVLNPTSANPACSVNNGSATITVTSGSANYTYTWSNTSTSSGAAPSNTISNLPIGGYTVTVTDLTGCTSTKTFTLTTTPAVGATTSFVAATCGTSNGSVSATPSGGNGTFTYLWNTGATTQTVPNLPAASYAVTITDGNGCTATASAIITNASGPTASIASSTNIDCFGQSTGSITASATGGNGGYTYSWDNGTPGATLNGVPAGTYIVSVRDGNNCLSTSSVTLNQSSQVTAAATGSASTCGNNNGQVNVNAGGGNPGYTYSWMPGNNATQMVTGLAPGIYTVTVSDVKGCTQITMATVADAAGPVAAIASSSNPLCNKGSNGSATASITSGGTPGFTYLWAPGGATTATVSGLSATIYTVMITDANNCTSVSTVSITEPSAVVPVVNSVDANCGQSNGTVSVSVSGGTPGYSYLWSPGGATSPTVSNLAAGNYFVSVTDANNCAKTGAAAVNNLGGAVVTVQSANDVTCFGGSNGSATATFTGGTAPLTYTWSNGASNTTSISNLIAGTYVFSVIDVNNCIGSGSVLIKQPAQYGATATAQGSTCGTPNGMAVATGSGGTAGYNYLWTNGTPSATASGLAPGAYVVTVTDAAGCTTTTSAVITDAPTGIISLGTISNVNCNGTKTGSATISVAGGTGTIAYNWSSGSTSTTAPNLGAGSYDVTITDANNCSATTTVLITEPTAISASFASTPATCNASNGEAIVTAGGGVPTYSYMWNNGPMGQTYSNIAAGNYDVTVMDANACTKTFSTSVSTINPPVANISAPPTICIGQSATFSIAVTSGTPTYGYTWNNGLVGAGPQTVSPVVPTTYNLTVTDAAGCTATQSVLVDVRPPLDLTLGSSVPSICLGATASITVNASGGNGNYTYSWLPAGSGSTIMVTPTTNMNYTVIVTDDCGTPASSTIIPLTVNLPPTVALSSDVVSGCGAPLCVNFTGISSATCVSSLWNFGDSTSSTASNPAHCYTKTGVYSVSLRCLDSNGCSTTQTASSMINVIARPGVNFTYAPSPIYPDSTLNFTNVSPGSDSWLWNFGDPGSGSSDTSTIFSPIHSYKDTGTYCVKLIAYAKTGCVDSTIKCLSVEEVCALPKDIPNVFSPNGDGMNDLFLMKSSGLSELTCTVYNRWGMLIYEYNAIRSGWDGRTFSDNTAPPGTYYYILKATCKLGAKLDGNGFLQLLR